MEKLGRYIGSFARDEEGAAASEYAILVAIICVVVYAAVKVFNLNNIFNTVGQKVVNCVNGTNCS